MAGRLLNESQSLSKNIQKSCRRLYTNSLSLPGRETSACRNTSRRDGRNDELVLKFAVVPSNCQFVQSNKGHSMHLFARFVFAFATTTFATCSIGRADVFYLFSDNGSGGTRLTATGNGLLDGLTNSTSTRIGSPASSFVDFVPEQFLIGSGNIDERMSLTDRGRLSSGPLFSTALTADAGNTNLLRAIPGNSPTFTRLRQNIGAEALILRGANRISGVGFSLDDSPRITVYDGGGVTMDNPDVGQIPLKTGLIFDNQNIPFAMFSPGATQTFTTTSGSVGSNTISFSVASVPEPSTMMLIGACSGLMLVFRRRRMHTH